MPNTAARRRRLRGIVEDFVALDVKNLGHAELVKHIEAIQERGVRVLTESHVRGNSESLPIARQKAAEANRKVGQATSDRVLPILKRLRAAGFATYEALARELNRQSIRPPVAKQWTKKSVHAIENRRPQLNH